MPGSARSGSVLSREGGNKPPPMQLSRRDLNLRNAILRDVREGTPLERIRALTELFQKFDADLSGEMDLDEFKVVLLWLEMPISDAGVYEIFKELDEDGSGCVDLQEFLQFFNIVERYEGMIENDNNEVSYTDFSLTTFGRISIVSTEITSKKIVSHRKLLLAYARTSETVCFSRLVRLSFSSLFSTSKRKTISG